jgi:hypothetical protein
LLGGTKELESVNANLEHEDCALKKLFGGFRAYIWLFAGLFVLYTVISPFVSLHTDINANLSALISYEGDAGVMLAMAVLLLALTAGALILALCRKLSPERLILILIAAGFILRFGYMLYTPLSVRGHDVGLLQGSGHLAYIYRIFSIQGLADNYSEQFYHPPLEHLACAFAAWLYKFISGTSDLNSVMEASRLIPCFASCALLLVTLRLFRAFGFSNRANSVALAVVAFHPSFILMSASINNDMLMILFFVSALLFTVRWYAEPTYKNILLLALSIGCAMSTKFSGALIALLTAVVFLLVLLRRYREIGIKRLILQFTAFGAVCIPLGLWYSVRNYILFGQPIGYVAQISTTNQLYIGDISLFKRFLSFSIPDMLTNVFCNPYKDFNLWEYVVKSALFGEFTYSAAHKTVAAVLILSSLLLIVLSLVAMVRFVLCGRDKNHFSVYTLAGLWALLMLSFVFFNLRYPFGCTMDFRYIAPTVIIGAAFLGLLHDKLNQCRIRNIMKPAFLGLLAIFCSFSAVFFII